MSPLMAMSATTDGGGSSPADGIEVSLEFKVLLAQYRADELRGRLAIAVIQSPGKTKPNSGSANAAVISAESLISGLSPSF